MSRFQAQTNRVLDAELERLRERLGLEPSQKADLLREVAALASWVLHQAEQGRSVEARRGDQVELLAHPAIERLRAERPRELGERLALSDDEAVALAGVLDRRFVLPPALRQALASLADAGRRPPKLRWKRSAS